MQKKSEIFVVALLLSLPFWLGANILGKNIGDFLVWKEFGNNSQVLIASVNDISQPKIDEKLKPVRSWDIPDFQIQAVSAISVLVDENKQNEKILFSKNSDLKLPMASLTKLMTALIVIETYDPSLTIEISKEAISQEGDIGQLKISEAFPVKDLLHMLLIESSNDAAYSLSGVIGTGEFVALMNLEANNLNLVNTKFANPAGLDDKNNYSTSKDLANLTTYLLNYPVLWDVLAKKDFDLYTPEGIFHHKLTNTNELLDRMPNIIGGKTGYTEQAHGCLMLVTKPPKGEGYLISIILGSPDRFGEMEKLVKWTAEAYQW